MSKIRIEAMTPDGKPIASWETDDAGKHMPTPSTKASIRIIKGVAGMAIYINDYRIAGSKPWGGGTEVCTFRVRREDIVQALGLATPPSKSK